ncbi:MAG: cache domain-containing protein, partial [Candidatus Cloacimonadota bacterium]|nr:cache domain-containing protein [Candidatus Cloacimonadota bacterium]
MKYEVEKIVFCIQNLQKKMEQYGNISDKEQFKNIIISDIVSLRFGEEGYFFGSTFSGDPLFSNGKITIGSANLWNLTDPNGVKIIQAQRKAAQNPNGGFIEYHWRKLQGEKLYPKLSFTMSVPEMEWMIGAGVYIDEIDKVIAPEKILFKQNVKVTLFKIGLSFILLIILLAIIAKHFSIKIKNNFEVFTSFFRKSETELSPINLDDFRFSELKNIAHSANRMVTERKQADEALQRKAFQMDSFINNIPDIAWLKDTNSNFIMVN